MVFGSAGAVKCARLEFCGCLVKPGGPKAAGASHDSPRAQTCTFEGHRLHKTPPKFHEKTPRERQKERNGGGRGEKRAKFWAVRRREVRGRGVRRRVVQTNNHTTNTNHNHNNKQQQHTTTHTQLPGSDRQTWLFTTEAAVLISTRAIRPPMTELPTTEPQARAPTARAAPATALATAARGI